jgi:hypothetical protein
VLEILLYLKLLAAALDAAETQIKQIGDQCCHRSGVWSASLANSRAKLPCATQDFRCALGRTTALFWEVAGNIQMVVPPTKWVTEGNHEISTQRPC